jgi:hypothetical protein
MASRGWVSGEGADGELGFGAPGIIGIIPIQNLAPSVGFKGFRGAPITW